MSLLQFDGCKIRSWSGEIPPALYEVDQSLEVSFAALAPGVNESRRAAIELKKLQGSRVHYGLLGATLSPVSTTSLDIKVCTSSNRLLRRYTDSIAHEAEDVRVGLPHQLARGIIPSSSQAIHQLIDMPAGQILFNCAAHTRTGSSELVFNRLSTALIKLLYDPEKARLS